jgi:soluble lytic murein transglycosylase-like protein
VNAALVRLVVLGWVLIAGPAFAGAYRVVDADGTIHITNVSSTLPRSPVASTPSRVESDSRADAQVPYLEAIERISASYGVDPTLVKAVIHAESAFNHRAMSPKGALGLMQLMPRVASALRVRDAFSPFENIEGGVRHLRYLLDRFAGNVPLALAAYNAGEGAVEAYRGIPPYPETQQYVDRILRSTGMRGTSQIIYRYDTRDGARVYSNVPPPPSSHASR